MSLRDYFAVQVAGGIFAANPDMRGIASNWPEVAYAAADAMLAEREKQHG
jgi:hypothetical protein